VTRARGAPHYGGGVGRGGVRGPRGRSNRRPTAAEAEGAEVRGGGGCGNGKGGRVPGAKISVGRRRREREARRMAEGAADVVAVAAAAGVAVGGGGQSGDVKGARQRGREVWWVGWGRRPSACGG